MKVFSANTWFIKWLLLLAIISYSLMQIVLLTQDLSLTRVVHIQSPQYHGVVVINNVKYKTVDRTQMASIAYEVLGPVHFLFMNSGIVQESFLAVLLNLSSAVLLGCIMWKFDFSDPFNPRVYKSILLIYKLIVWTLIVEVFSDCYTKAWADRYFNHFQNSGFAYTYGTSVDVILFVWLPAITAGMCLYRKAVNNREELDLTI